MYSLRVGKALFKSTIPNVRTGIILVLFLIPAWITAYSSFFKECPCNELPSSSVTPPESTSTKTKPDDTEPVTENQVKEIMYASEEGAKPCERKRYLGDEYGGWMVCEPANPKDFKRAIVYTVGVGENIEWDKAMMSYYGTVHHGWDPTPRAVDFIRTKPPPHDFHFHKYGLSSKDGFVRATLPVGNHASYTISQYEHAEAQEGKETQIPVLHIQSMLKMLNHKHISVLKIDIEGSEFDVIQHWAENNYHVPADQILIEFHERYFNSAKSLVTRAIEQMQSIGFQVFHRTKLEISFIRTSN